MSKENNIKNILNKEIDFLEENEITINLINDTVIIDDDVYNEVNFIRLKILGIRDNIIKNVDNLKNLLSKNPNIEVLIKRIDMNELHMGIITKLSNLCICDTDAYISKPKNEDFTKNKLGEKNVKDESGNIVYVMSLYHTVNYDGAEEYNLEVNDGKYLIKYTYGSIFSKYYKVDFDKITDINYFNLNNTNNITKEELSSFSDQLDYMGREDMPDFVNEVTKLLNKKLINMMFQEELKNL